MDFYGLILFFFLSIEMMIDFKTINMIKSVNILKFNLAVTMLAETQTT